MFYASEYEPYTLRSTIKMQIQRPREPHTLKSHQKKICESNYSLLLFSLDLLLTYAIFDIILSLTFQLFSQDNTIVML